MNSLGKKLKISICLFLLSIMGEVSQANTPFQALQEAPAISSHDFIENSHKKLEGKNLSWKERLGLKILRKKLNKFTSKKNKKRDQNCACSQASNKTSNIFGQAKGQYAPTDEVLQTDPMAVASAIFGIISVLSLVFLSSTLSFVLPFLTGIIAVILGIISLIRIKKNPDKYKGFGLSISMILAGLIGFIGILIIASNFCC